MIELVKNPSSLEHAILVFPLFMHLIHSQVQETRAFPSVAWNTFKKKKKNL